MKIAIVIFRKELLDSLRDRRTLFTMIVMPLLLFPLLISISSRMMLTQTQKAREKILKVGLDTHGNAMDFRASLMSRKDMIVIEGIPLETARRRIRGDSLDAYLDFDPRFDDRVESLSRARITFYFKSKDREAIGKSRVQEELDQYGQRLLESRFARLGLSPDIHRPLDIEEQNLASVKERLAEAVGGFLPYLFILFCFMGAMYPAIDLAAGEKERGTMETLLTTPAGRFQILAGKFGVVVLTGIGSAVISMLGMYLGIRQVSEIPPQLFTVIMSILEWRSIVMLFTLLLPLTVFFAAILLSVSLFARSFKEAQSAISPMTIAVIVPAFIGLLPGMELNAVTALIPILNVSLSTKAIIADSVSPILMLEVYGSLIFYAAVSLLLCTRVFSNENIILRT